MLTSFFVVLFACAVYGLVHSLLASLAAKAQSRRCLGGAAARYYRLFFNLQSLLTLLPVLWLAGWLPDQLIYAVPLPWLAVTLGLQAVGVLGLMLGVLQTGALAFLGLDAFLPGTPRAPAQALVARGLYAWVRHPLYTCGLLVYWLSPRLTWNSLALGLGFTAYTLVGIIFEERKLVREFGQAYLDYRRRTPALLPYKIPGRSR
jgi:protein-S-isoprenylcysteine O-methyltransferase Ste14